MFGDIEDFVLSEWSVGDLIAHWQERCLLNIIFFVDQSQISQHKIPSPGANMGFSYFFSTGPQQSLLSSISWLITGAKPHFTAFSCVFPILGGFFTFLCEVKLSPQERVHSRRREFLTSEHRKSRDPEVLWC